MLAYLYRSLSINRKNIVFVLFFLTILLFYLDLKLIINHDVTPPFISKYDLGSARLLIENLCQLYNDKQNPQILGNICKDLCKASGNYETYKSYKLSGRYDPGSGVESRDDVQKAYIDFKTVLVFQDRHNSSQKFVLKSQKKYFQDVDTHMDFDFVEKSVSGQLDFLIEYIETTLKSKFGLDLGNQSGEWLRLYKKHPELALDKLDKYSDKEDLNYYVRLFYLDEYKTYLRALQEKDKRLLARFITNFVVLTGQDEYLFYKLFQSKPGALKIKGTCGHFYMTEYVETLEGKVSKMNSLERKSLAASFLELIHSLDTAYLVKRTSNGLLSSTPIQFCDVKLDNFGLDQQGKLRIIDTDTAFPDSYIFRSRRCASHDDCHFFACLSFCDPTTQRCLTRRINNNLQAFCQNILNNSIAAQNGILSGADNLGSNLHSEIMSRLSKCQAPGFYLESDVPVGANDSIIRSLSTLLQHNSI